MCISILSTFVHSVTDEKKAGIFFKGFQICVCVCVGTVLCSICVCICEMCMTMCLHVYNVCVYLCAGMPVCVIFVECVCVCVCRYACVCITFVECMCTCVCACVCMHMCTEDRAGIRFSWARTANIMSLLTWVLGMQIRPTRRAVHQGATLQPYTTVPNSYLLTQLSDSNISIEIVISNLWLFNVGKSHLNAYHMNPMLFLILLILWIIEN